MYRVCDSLHCSFLQWQYIICTRPHTDTERQQFDVLSFVAKNSIKLDITWERIADTLEHFMDMGNLARDIRRKFTAADQRPEEGLYLTIFVENNCVSRFASAFATI